MIASLAILKQSILVKKCKSTTRPFYDVKVKLLRVCDISVKIIDLLLDLLFVFICLIPEPTARTAVPGVSPVRGLLIPLSYLHPGKYEHSEVQSHFHGCHGRSTVFVVTRMRE